MKKSRCLFIGMLMASCLLVFSFTGCGKTGEKEPEQTNTEKPEQNIENVANPEGDKTDQESEPTPVEDAESRDVTIYYVDDQTAEVTGKSVEIQNEQDIWNALIENGILTEECELLSLSINEEEKKIDLDFNAATGDRIRSMGTTGETQIIGCIVNTYLEAYGCNGIRLTEEGQPLQTSHGANYDGYSGMVAF